MWHQFIEWLARLMGYQPIPRGIQYIGTPPPLPVSGGSGVVVVPPQPHPIHPMIEPDIVLGMNNTLDLVQARVYSLKFFSGNRLNIANVGQGNIWFRVDGQDAFVDDIQSEMLPPAVADNDVPINNYLSIVSDVGARVIIRCHY